MGHPPVLTSSQSFRHFIDGSLAFASLNHACRNLVPAFSATFTTIAFDDSSLRWLEINT
jgi:hypothetical protein